MKLYCSVSVPFKGKPQFGQNWSFSLTEAEQHEQVRARGTAGRSITGSINDNFTPKYIFYWIIKDYREYLLNGFLGLTKILIEGQNILSFLFGIGTHRFTGTNQIP